MPDKLSIINDELALCGQNQVNVADDGSPEWRVGSAAYESAVEYLLDEHDWKFGTAIVFTEDRVGDSPDPFFDDEYNKPPGCLHLIWVRDEGGTPLPYKIVGNKIEVSKSDGISVKFVEEPGTEQWPGLFIKALRHLVRAGIYRGLNKSTKDAAREEEAAELYLRRARPRGDQEEPGRPRFISSALEARRTRRA